MHFKPSSQDVARCAARICPVQFNLTLSEAHVEELAVTFWDGCVRVFTRNPPHFGGDGTDWTVSQAVCILIIVGHFSLCKNFNAAEFPLQPFVGSEAILSFMNTIRWTKSV